MNFLATFLKCTVAGIGGAAPGLSGSVLLVIFGLYDKLIHAISTLFKNFKQNILLLIPLVAGMGVGLWVFSKIVDFCLENFAFVTRYCFFGLVIGTVPLFYREMIKNGFRKRYYFVVVASAAVGMCLFLFNKNLFPVVTEPQWWQSVLLGVTVAGVYIIPGVDSAAILSSFGFYELWVSSLANLDFTVLLPAAIGIVGGALGFSSLMNLLLKRVYTATFSVIFGLFLSVIPGMLNESCAIANMGQGATAAGLTVLGFAVSFYLGDLKGNNARIRRLFCKAK